MTLLRYQPWGLLLDAAQTRSAAVQAAAIAPRVDVHEEKQRYVLRADLPGVLPADIEVTTDQGVLALRAERRAAASADDTDSSVTRLERSHGTYQRHFTLPDDAALDAIDAKYTNGVLELVIPKHAKAEPRRITVAAA